MTVADCTCGGPELLLKSGLMEFEGKGSRVYLPRAVERRKNRDVVVAMMGMRTQPRQTKENVVAE